MCSYWGYKDIILGVSYLVIILFFGHCFGNMTLYLGMFVRIMLCLFWAHSDKEVSGWYDDLVLDFDWLDYRRCYRIGDRNVETAASEGTDPSDSGTGRKADSVIASPITGRVLGSRETVRPSIE